MIIAIFSLCFVNTIGLAVLLYIEYKRPLHFGSTSGGVIARTLTTRKV